ncbi:protein kinase [Streptomyces sp. NPDC012637]|uniref:protein kinase domain-containing protein n=1 Tax=Streptomyces sp. NPDC012637 TaxID=3364842 RepID=UPI0036E337AD
MVETPPPPGEALAHLQDHVGQPYTTRLLSDRRGSRAWEVHGPRGAVALKANNPDDETARDKAAEIAQEDNHLTRLIAAGALSPGYRIDAGIWDGGRWIAVRWCDGTPLWRTLAPARGPEGDRRSVRPWLLGIARTWAASLARMHAAGWAHADVQPTNTLVADGRAVLIDYALACGPGDDARLPYRGALTHTTAPEIAAAVLATPADTHVQAEPPADVWGLGASLFWCWTGHRPVAYDDTVDRSEKLRAVAKGSTLPVPEFRPWPFPEFEEVVTACLAPAPEDRPTAAVVADMLASR